MNKLSPKTKLEKDVAKWLNSHGADYEDKWQGAAKDLMYGGCQSGIVCSLVYYTNTVKFYKKHRAEIDRLLSETMRDLDMKPSDLRGWDDDDPLARDVYNQNVLAWFAFEEITRRLFDN